MAGGIGLLEIWRFQHENNSAHAIVNFAVHRDHAGLIENDRGWFFVLAIATEIEALRFRIRKHIVVGVVHVWEIDGSTNAHGDEIGRERDIFLRHLGRRVGARFAGRTEGAFEINNCRGRIARREWGFDGALITLIDRSFHLWLGQLDKTFNGGVGFGGGDASSDGETDGN